MCTLEERKNSRKQALQWKFHQKVKQQGRPLYQIFGTILKMDKTGTHTNVLEHKKVDDDAQGLTS